MDEYICGEIVWSGEINKKTHSLIYKSMDLIMTSDWLLLVTVL